MRYDGSSRFLEDVRWGLFPSVSAGWVISKESFLENVAPINFLKLRASWGQVGNQNVGYYPFANSLSQTSYYFNGVPNRGVQTAGAPNPFLTWETKSAFNLGFEGRFFRNKLEVNVDVFKERTSDILLALPLPTTFGQNEPVQNAGTVDNQGWELELAHRNKIGAFTYGVSFQISNAKNKVVSMGGISPIINGNVITEEGYSMNEWFGLRSIGFFQSAQEVTNAPFQNALTSPGDLRYENNGEIPIPLTPMTG
ncbi:MAG: TonB-dependent receptor [Bacteroidota bacterium]